LRETYEELAIAPSRVEVFAELGWQQTSVHHRVKPFAGRVSAPLSLQPNPDEVAQVLYLPVSRLRADLFERRGIWRDRQSREHVLYRFDLDGHEVWGLTARILRDFLAESEEFRAEIDNAR